MLDDSGENRNASITTNDELEIRPIWHQKEDGVQAHILVRFLAYAL